MSYHESHTLQSRALTLLTRCKKAIRLYSRNHKSHRSDKDRLSDIQITRWRETNEQLFAELYELLAPVDQRESNLRREIEGIESRYAVLLRGLESELDRKRGELQRALDREEFIACAELSASLVEARANFQATRAALGELRSVLGRQSSGGEPYERPPLSSDASELFSDDTLFVEEGLSTSRERIQLGARRSALYGGNSSQHMSRQETTEQNSESVGEYVSKTVEEQGDEAPAKAKVIPLRRPL